MLPSLTCRLLLAAVLLLPGGRAVAQVLDPTFAAPSSLYAPGTAYVMGPPQADGKRLLAGNFTRVNGAAYSGTLLRLAATGATDLAFAQNAGAATNVFRIKTFANGQYLLGAEGGSITAGGLARTEVMRLNTDGTGDASFDAGTGPAMTNDAGLGYDYTAQPDGKVLVAGYFDSFNGVAANGLVRLTATGSVDALFAAPFVLGAQVGTILVQPDGKILVGGLFSTGTLSTGLVRLNTNGSLDTSFSLATSFDGIPYTLGVQANNIGPAGRGGRPIIESRNQPRPYPTG